MKYSSEIHWENFYFKNSEDNRIVNKRNTDPRIYVYDLCFRCEIDTLDFQKHSNIADYTTKWDDLRRTAQKACMICQT